MTHFALQEVHLDKLDYQGDQSLLYTNLSRLMVHSPRAAKLRRIVVNIRPPNLKYEMKNSWTELVLSDTGRAIMKDLNPLQQRAVLLAMVCRVSL